MKIYSEAELVTKINKIDLTLEKKAKLFDIQQTRMWRVLHGGELKASEYIKFLKYLRRKGQIERKECDEK